MAQQVVSHTVYMTAETDVTLPQLEGANEALVEELRVLLLGNKKVEAVQKFRLATGCSLKDAVDRLIIGWWMEFAQSLIDPSKYPEKCCFNCVGTCGKLANLQSTNGAKLWDIDNQIPCGTNCSVFMTLEALKKSLVIKDSAVQVKLTNSANSSVTNIIVDTPIVKTERSNRDGKVLETKFVIHSKSQVVTKVSGAICKLFLAGFQWSSTNGFEGTLTVGTCEPKSKETWEKYLERASEEVRKARECVTETYQAMDEKTLFAAMEKFLTKRGLKNVIANYNGDIESLCDDMFPDQELVYVAIEFAREDLS